MIVFIGYVGAVSIQRSWNISFSSRPKPSRSGNTRDSEIPHVAKSLRMSLTASLLIWIRHKRHSLSLTESHTLISPSRVRPKIVKRLRWAAKRRATWEGSIASGYLGPSSSLSNSSLERYSAASRHSGNAVPRGRTTFATGNSLNTKSFSHQGSSIYTTGSCDTFAGFRAKYNATSAPSDQSRSLVGTP